MVKPISAIDDINNNPSWKITIEIEMDDKKELEAQFRFAEDSIRKGSKTFHFASRFMKGGASQGIPCYIRVLQADG